MLPVSMDCPFLIALGVLQLDMDVMTIFITYIPPSENKIKEVDTFEYFILHTAILVFI
jgi:hypothetical protein